MDRKVRKALNPNRWIKRSLFLGIPVGLLVWLLLSINPTPRLISNHEFGGRSAGVGLAPSPSKHPGAVIQVYSARTWGFKGLFAVHSWIAIKEENEKYYKVSQIVGWARDTQGSSLFTQIATPDKTWYGNPPELLLDIRGAEAKALIPQVQYAINQYPWKDKYQLWPGPNSNTFISWIGLQVPDLGLDLPAKAIGKDWRPIGNIVGKSASGTGIQASLLGIAGVSAGFEEGLEINLLGLNLELDVFDLAVELPIVGRIGKDHI